MRVLILYNPISGTGDSEIRASDLAEELAGAALSDGRQLVVETLPTRLEPTESWLDPELRRGVDLLVVIGGWGGCGG